MKWVLRLGVLLGACLVLGAVLVRFLDGWGERVAPIEPLRPAAVSAAPPSGRIPQELVAAEVREREAAQCAPVEVPAEFQPVVATVHGPTRRHERRFDSGVLSEQGLVRDGERHGYWVTRWPDGGKRAQGEYVDGKKVGLWVQWHRFGQVASAGSYCDGLREGFWTHWYPNGVKWMEGHYVGGSPVEVHHGQEGLWTYWYRGGAPMRRGEMRGGWPVGPWEDWERDGRSRIVDYSPAPDGGAHDPRGR